LKTLTTSWRNWRRATGHFVATGDPTGQTCCIAVLPQRGQSGDGAGRAAQSGSEEWRSGTCS
jgi:hypothetical protein